MRFFQSCDYIYTYEALYYAAKYRYFGRNWCLHLHIIRLCFNKSTKSGIKMSIIRRGRIKHFDIRVSSTCLRTLNYIRTDTPSHNAMNDVTHFVESMKCNCVRISYYWLKNPSFCKLFQPTSPVMSVNPDCPWLLFSASPWQLSEYFRVTVNLAVNGVSLMHKTPCCLCRATGLIRSAVNSKFFSFYSGLLYLHILVVEGYCGNW